MNATFPVSVFTLSPSQHARNERLIRESGNAQALTVLDMLTSEYESGHYSQSVHWDNVAHLVRQAGLARRR